MTFPKVTSIPLVNRNGTLQAFGCTSSYQQHETKDNTPFFLSTSLSHNVDCMSVSFKSTLEFSLNSFCPQFTAKNSICLEHSFQGGVIFQSSFSSCHQSKLRLELALWCIDYYFTGDTQSLVVLLSRHFLKDLQSFLPVFQSTANIK